MNIKMQKRDSSDELKFSTWDIGIIGETVDERGCAAIEFIKINVKKIISVQYNSNDLNISINGNILNVEDFQDYLISLKGKSIILETTTLGFAEILLCSKAWFSLGSNNMDLLYIEPEQYNNPNRKIITNKRDFELSDEVPGYKAIPGTMFMLSDRYKQFGVFFLGYEEQRLDRVFQDFEMINPSRCTIIFGVPAFKPGWEMDAIANNIRVIENKNIKGGIKFCGAENPASVILLLEKIYKSVEPNGKMFIVPIGTKPNGIGVALFVSIHDNVGILYDHPVKRGGRSEKVSKWHLFTAEL